MVEKEERKRKKENNIKGKKKKEERVRGTCHNKIQKEGKNNKKDAPITQLNFFLPYPAREGSEVHERALKNGPVNLALRRSTKAMK